MEKIAEEILFPAAMEIDRAASVPRSYLDELAAAGLYDLPGDPASAAHVIETLAGASLVTTFVWIQHHSPVRAVAAAGGALADRWLSPLRAGAVRAGIAYAALRRPGPPSATAVRRPDGSWVLDGFAPWVTGWGLVDVVLAGARCGDPVGPDGVGPGAGASDAGASDAGGSGAGGDVVWLLLDARADRPAGFTATPVELATMQASSTYELRWSGFEVPAERVVGIEPFADWRRRDSAGRASNGYLAVGVAARCAQLLGSPALAAEVDAARQALLDSTPATVVAARARASLLAVRAATALVTAGGGRSVEASAHAARLMREATFLLVFGQSPDIKAAQLAALDVGPA